MKNNVIMDPQDWINDVSSEAKEMYALDDILYDQIGRASCREKV